MNKNDWKELVIEILLLSVLLILSLVIDLIPMFIYIGIKVDEVYYGFITSMPLGCIFSLYGLNFLSKRDNDFIDDYRDILYKDIKRKEKKRKEKKN